MQCRATAGGGGRDDIQLCTMGEGRFYISWSRGTGRICSWAVSLEEESRHIRDEGTQTYEGSHHNCEEGVPSS